VESIALKNVNAPRERPKSDVWGRYVLAQVGARPAWCTIAAQIKQTSPDESKTNADCRTTIQRLSRPSSTTRTNQAALMTTSARVRPNTAGKRPLCLQQLGDEAGQADEQEELLQLSVEAG